MIIKKRRIYILFFITGFFLAWAVGASGFEIVDVQTTGDEGLSDECVKIKNTGDAPFSLLGLILQSHSSNPDSNRWTSRSGDGLPEIIMEPNEMIILASSDYSGDDYAWKHTVSWGLSDNGGGMRIVQKNDDGNIVTIFAEKYWGSLEEIEPEPEYIPEPVPEPEPTPIYPEENSAPETIPEPEPTPEPESEQATSDNSDNSWIPASAGMTKEEIIPDYSSFQITISEFMPDPHGSEARRTIAR